MRYTTAEDKVIAEHYPDFATLARLLPHRTQIAVGARAGFLGLKTPVPLWTRREERILRSTHPDLDEAARQLPHRTREAIRRRCNRLGLKSYWGRYKWTEQRTEIFVQMTAMARNAEIAKILGVPVSVIRTKKKSLNLSGPSIPTSKNPIIPLMVDIRAEAFARGISLRSLTRHVGRQGLSVRMKKFCYPVAAKVVADLGGELVAEWFD